MERYPFALLAYVPDGHLCYWGRWGGSLIISDLDRRLTIAYVMNKMAPGILGSPRSERAIYDVLGVPTSGGAAAHPRLKMPHRPADGAWTAPLGPVSAGG